MAGQIFSLGLCESINLLGNIIAHESMYIISTIIFSSIKELQKTTDSSQPEKSTNQCISVIPQTQITMKGIPLRGI